MNKILFTAALALALTSLVGCGSSGTGSGQPKLSDPNDPKAKALQPASPGGGPPKQNAASPKAPSAQ